MAKDILTFALEGDIVLEQFSSAISHFNSLLNNLSKEVGKGANIDWAIDELFAGSAVATFHGIYDDLSIVEDVINAYEEIGDSLVSGREIPYSEIIRGNVRNLTSIIDGRISAIRFETPTREFLISGKPLLGERVRPLKYGHGTVKGTVQTLSMRKKLSFTLWDSLFDKPVNCYLKEGEEENMRNVWGKRAVVSGKVGRQYGTGRPIVIREVRYIKILVEKEPGSFKHAKGVIPWIEGDEPPEEIIRRLRDA